MRGRPLSLLAAMCIAGALTLGSPVAALAHDGLVASSPEADSTVAEVDGIELTFSNVLLELGENQRSTAIQVRSDGRYFETACPTLSGPTASAPAALGEAGEYEVLWQVVSSDGHPTSGTYTFTYEPAAGAAVAAGADAPACSKVAAEAGGNEDALLLGAAAAVVGFAGIGVLAAVLLARRRRGEPLPERGTDASGEARE